MLNAVNNISFGATLDLTKVKGHKKKWYRAADEFEKITQKRRKYNKLYLKTIGDNKDIDIEGRTAIRGEITTIAKLSHDYAEKLLQLSPKKMARKLKVIYDIFGYKEKVFKNSGDLWNKLFEYDNYDGQENMDRLSDKFFTSIEAAENAVIQDWLKKDTDILSKSNVEIGY